jgi:citrate lyase beta subunit
MAGRRPEHRSIASYERGRDLRALLPVRRVDLKAEGLTAQARLVARLRQALRLERRRGHVGSWSYHPGRHASLLQAYRAERASLERARQGRPREA